MARIRVSFKQTKLWMWRYAGDRIKREGYIWIWVDSRYIGEHRLIVEKAIGRRLLSTEEVHHVDGKKDNNNNTNLVVCERDYHRYLDICRALKTARSRPRTAGRLSLIARLERSRKEFLSQRPKAMSSSKR